MAKQEKKNYPFLITAVIAAIAIVGFVVLLTTGEGATGGVTGMAAGRGNIECSGDYPLITSNGMMITNRAACGIPPYKPPKTIAQCRAEGRVLLPCL